MGVFFKDNLKFLFEVNSCQCRRSDMIDTLYSAGLSTCDFNFIIWWKGIE
jgi:hypothetical protein